MAGAERSTRERPRSGRTAEVRIDGIASGGAGVGRLPSGQAVFVHRTAPGELTRVRVTEQRKRWARADLLEVLEPAAERRQAPCPHYGRCGGCTLEHLEYDAQLVAKAAMVRDALNRIGGLDVETPAVTASPEEFRYRNRLSLTLRRLRAGRVVAGFHELGSPDRVFDVTADCLLPEPALAEAWDALRDAWGPDARCLPSGPELRLTLRTTAGGEHMLLIEGGTGEGEPDEILRAVPGLRAIWHAPALDEPATRLAGDDVLERWGGQEVRLTGRTFLQVNRAAAERLEAYVLEAAGVVDGASVVDAYCGVGAHARRLAERGARVVGIEIEEAAVEEARRGAPENAEFVAGDVAAELASRLPADLVVANPPRGGLAPEVSAALAASPPKRLVYVSCDPATLARDAGRLAPLRLVSTRCFDLFPQTAHVETVAVFE